MSQFRFGFQLYNREQMPQEQFQRVKQKQIPVQRVQRKIEIPQLQLAQEAMRSKIVRMTLEQTFDERDTLNQAVARIVNETAKAWSIARFERSTHPPRSSRQWRCWRKPSDANVRRSCRVKETSRAKSFWHEESNKIAIVLNSSHQLKIPVHILNRSRSSQDITVVLESRVRNRSITFRSD